MTKLLFMDARKNSLSFVGRLSLGYCFSFLNSISNIWIILIWFFDFISGAILMEFKSITNTSNLLTIHNLTLASKSQIFKTSSARMLDIIRSIKKTLFITLLWLIPKVLVGTAHAFEFMKDYLSKDKKRTFISLKW